MTVTDRGNVATGDHTSEDAERRLANAAPDMLKALHEAAGAIWELHDWRDEASYEADPSMKAIRAAIAKATGQSQ